METTTPKQQRCAIYPDMTYCDDEPGKRCQHAHTGHAMSGVYYVPTCDEHRATGGLYRIGSLFYGLDAAS